MTLKQSGHVT